MNVDTGHIMTAAELRAEMDAQKRSRYERVPDHMQDAALRRHAGVETPEDTHRLENLRRQLAAAKKRKTKAAKRQAAESKRRNRH